MLSTPAWFPFVVRAAVGRGGVSSWHRIRMTTITSQGPPKTDLHTLRLEADVRVVRHVDTVSKTYRGDPHTGTAPAGLR